LSAPPLLGVDLPDADVLLGASVAAELSLVAAEEALEAPTLHHASLTLEVLRPGAPEPAYWFPNCSTMCLGGEPIRMGRNGGTARLAAGERRSERFDLSSGYPVDLLDVGERLVSFSLGGGAETVRGGPARLRISSGPGAVPHLLDLLERGEVSTRYRAAALLRRMTGRGLPYDASGDEAGRASAVAAWRAWWEREGRSLAWRSDATRASLPGEDPEASGAAGAGPAAGAAARLGGVVHPRGELPPKDRWALVKTLDAWVAKGRPEARLPGAALVADDAVSWPPGDGPLVCDKALEAALLRALERLAREAPARPDERQRDGLLLVATAARAPSPELAAPLFALERDVPRRAPGWAPTLALAGGLLDWLDDERVRVGG